VAGPTPAPLIEAAPAPEARRIAINIVSGQPGSSRGVLAQGEPGQ
jgi:hypothetical protein